MPKNTNYPPFFLNEYTAWKFAASHGSNQTRAPIINEPERYAYYNRKRWPSPLPITRYDEEKKTFFNASKHQKHEPKNEHKAEDHALDARKIELGSKTLASG